MDFSGLYKSSRGHLVIFHARILHPNREVPRNNVGIVVEQEKLPKAQAIHSNHLGKGWRAENVCWQQNQIVADNALDDKIATALQRCFDQ